MSPRTGILVVLTLFFATQVIVAQETEWAVAVFPSGAEFNLELARTDRERELGYMFREHVGPREGMLFFMGESRRHVFWMKNCKTALDLIWLDEHFEVAYIAHEQPPCPERGDCLGIAPMKAGKYVLEVAGGRAREEKLRTGDRIVILAEGSIR